MSAERAASSQRTRPALPGATASTYPLNTRRLPIPASGRSSGRVIWTLLILGILLECTYLALYPLLAVVTDTRSQTNQQQIQQIQQIQQALPTLFPWLPHLYWTNALPALPSLLSHISWLNLLDSHSQNIAATILAMVLLFIAGLFAVLASRTGNRALRDQTVSPITSYFSIMLLLSVLFGLTMVLSPISLNVFSREMLTSGLYGRMIAIHHVNPYSVAPTAFSHDFLQSILGLTSTTSFGPAWLDTSFGLMLLAGESVANTLLNFRILALFAHLVNAILLWSILGRLKPHLRLSLSLLYAWNPLILLFGIAYMHQEIVLLSVILLAIFFFQRNSPTLGWVFVVASLASTFLSLHASRVAYLARQSASFVVDGHGCHIGHCYYPRLCSLLACPRLRWLYNTTL